MKELFFSLRHHVVQGIMQGNQDVPFYSLFPGSLQSDNEVSQGEEWTDSKGMRYR